MLFISQDDTVTNDEHDIFSHLGVLSQLRNFDTTFVFKRVLGNLWSHVEENVLDIHFLTIIIFVENEALNEKA